MTESNSSGIPHLKKTLPIKKIQGKDLIIDVYYVDAETSAPRPAILYFHGGFLVRKLFARAETMLTYPRYPATPTPFPTG
jgi:hypothetical protein